MGLTWNQHLRVYTAACVLLWLLPAGAQHIDTATSQRFEVASVRPRENADGRPLIRLGPDGRVRILNMPLRSIIARAYAIDARMERHILVGGRDEVLDARFDIEAIPPAQAGPAERLEMLRALLGERFGLEVRKELRTRDVYAVTAARQGVLGPRLRRSVHNCVAYFNLGGRASSSDKPEDAEGRPLCFVVPNFDQMRAGIMTLRNAGSIRELVLEAQPHVDRPLVDGTGLEGNFEWTTTFAMTLNSESMTTPSIFTALEQDLGLKIEPRRAPLDVLVIDHVSWPTPN